ncbi:hypothetical protein ACOME3_008862 [Neoechinorhynchus agilis]
MNPVNDTSDAQFESAEKKFKDIFGLKDDKLLKYCSCCHWNHVIPRQGWMYISTEHLCFYAFFMGRDFKIAIKYLDITDLKHSTNQISQRIVIQTNRGSTHVFSMLLNFEEIFGFLHKMIDRSVQHFLSDDRSENSVKTEAAYMHDDIGEILKQDYIREEFRLPSTECIEHEAATCAVILPFSKKLSLGRLIVTNNFLIFQSKTKHLFAIVLSFRHFKSIHRATSSGLNYSMKVNMDPIGSLEFINLERSFEIVEDCERFISFCQKKCLKLHNDYEKVITEKKRSLRELAGPLYLEYSNSDNVEMKTSEVERETNWLYHWDLYCWKDQYYRVNALRELFFAGLPQSHRARIWMQLSGANHYRLMHPGLYHKLINDSLDNLSEDILEEIERDLHRSLPEHNAFQNKDGIDALRRVLQCYAKHDPSIGEFPLSTSVKLLVFKLSVISQILGTLFQSFDSKAVS